MSATAAPQLTRLFVTDLATAVDETIGCKPDGTRGPCLAPSTTLFDTSNGTTTTMTGCPADPKVVGQPIAVAFAGDGGVVVQSREPAMLALADGTSITPVDREPGRHRPSPVPRQLGRLRRLRVVPHRRRRRRAGVELRLRRQPAAAAGARRTQSLQTGLRGTEPFHWNGDEADFTQLMTDVFVGRMSGPKLTPDLVDAMVTWIDAQPRPRRPAVANPAAVQRGAALFNDTAERRLRQPAIRARASPTTRAWTSAPGGAFQVPSLVGIGTRGPFMHDGCAATLRDRFNPACGGAPARRSPTS